MMRLCQFVALLLLAVGGCVMVGCQSLNAQPPVEQFANKLADEAIIPAIREGLAQGVEQLSIQAGAQGINPTYAVMFEGKWVVGVEGRASVGVEGVAGQIQVSSTSNEETETSPHGQDVRNTPTTQPTATAEPQPATTETQPANKDDR